MGPNMFQKHVHVDCNYAYRRLAMHLIEDNWDHPAGFHFVSCSTAVLQALFAFLLLFGGDS